MRTWMQKIIQNDAEGDLKIKMITTRIRPENCERLLWDILQIIILFFNNCTLNKITAQMMRNIYQTEVNEKVNYSFEYVDIDKL